MKSSVAGSGWPTRSLGAGGRPVSPSKLWPSRPGSMWTSSGGSNGRASPSQDSSVWPPSPGVPIDSPGEPASRGEDRCRVRVPAGVHHVDGLVYIGGSHNREDRTEQLVLPELHVRRDPVEDRGPEEEAIGRTRAAAVKGKE